MEGKGEQGKAGKMDIKGKKKWRLRTKDEISGGLGKHRKKRDKKTKQLKKKSNKGRKGKRKEN